MKEEWRDIVGYEGLYQVSNLGRVKVLRRTTPRFNGHKVYVYEIKEKILKQSYQTNGYKIVSLQKNKKSKTKMIHRLVAEAFIDNPNGLPQINHKDGNKQNNCVSNLEWCTNLENAKHATYVLKLRMKKVICVETNSIYSSILEASYKTKINNSSIGQCCLGKRKTAGGYHWRYV